MIRRSLAFMAGPLAGITLLAAPAPYGRRKRPARNSPPTLPAWN